MTSATDMDQARTLGPLDIPRELSAVLARLRGAAGGPANVDADELHRIEVTMAYRFADDLLATWASRAPILVDDYQLGLSRVIAHTGELATTGAPGDLIGLGRAGDHFLCLPKRLNSAGETRVCLYDPDRNRSEAPLPLSQWLATLLPTDTGTPGEFCPTLTRTLPTGSSGKRVRHPTFGEGRVYTETGTGPTRKVKVDFPKVGLKLLQARFLEFLDEPPADGD